MATRRLCIVEATHAAQIARVRTLFAQYATSLGWDPSGGGWISDEIASLPGPYAAPRGALLLATLDGEPVGALGLQPVPGTALIADVGAETAGELKRLYVCPEARRHGVGRALMERAEDEALSRGYDSLVLTTSAEMMPLAQTLYDELGYSESVPYRDDMPWPDIRWMRKEL